eukprot:306662-Chlamydomonas_euryale.AAC.6
MEASNSPTGGSLDMQFSCVVRVHVPTVRHAAAARFGMAASPAMHTNACAPELNAVSRRHAFHAQGTCLLRPASRPSYPVDAHGFPVFSPSLLDDGNRGSSPGSAQHLWHPNSPRDSSMPSELLSQGLQLGFSEPGPGERRSASAPRGALGGGGFAADGSPRGTAVLGMAKARGAARGALHPLMQNKLNLRTNITPATLARPPDFRAPSLLAAALEYELPARQPAQPTGPALLLDAMLQPSGSAHGGGGTTSPTRLGTFVPPRDAAAAPRTLLSTTVRLPHAGGAGPGGGGDGALGVSAQVLRTMLRGSRSEEYTFDVPAGVSTGDDAVRLFASSGAKAGLIVFCNLNPATNTPSSYNPYDLMVVQQAHVNPSFFYIMSQ